MALAFFKNYVIIYIIYLLKRGQVVFMNVFLILAFLFFIGSMIGWVLELFYRKMISERKWINPGFLVGPYLPLYGFGLCTFYLLSQINLNRNLDYINYDVCGHRDRIYLTD